MGEGGVGEHEKHGIDGNDPPRRLQNKKSSLSLLSPFPSLARLRVFVAPGVHPAMPWTRSSPPSPRTPIRSQQCRRRREFVMVAFIRQVS